MIMKYKDLGNQLSSDEMKRVIGGYKKPPCSVGLECMAYTPIYGGQYYPGTCTVAATACACTAYGPEGIIHDIGNMTCNLYAE